MTRVDELQRKYPEIPRDVILKLEVLVQNINTGGDLDKLSTWTRAFVKGSYHSKGTDGSLKELAEKSPDKIKDGQILRPPREVRFRNGLGAELRLSNGSPYSIRQESEGKFALYENDDRVDNVYFPRPKPRTGPEPVTSKGRPISVLLLDLRTCFYMNATRYCQYFTTGEECRFCNLNQAQQDARFAGLDVPITMDPDEVTEAFRIRNSEVRQIEGFLTMGGMAKPGQAIKVMIKYVERLSTAAPNKPNLTTNAHLASRQEMQRLREAGLNCYGIQIEMMHPAFFPVICPGKAKNRPYEGWIEAIHDAVDIFGPGNVAVTPMVPGISLLFPNMHDTWQEARDYHIEVNDFLIKSGALPSFLPMWWAEGSVVSQDKSNQAKFPPSDYHLDVALAHHKAMLKHGLYGKLNKLMLCGLHCTASYAGDIGMLTLPDNVGKWMSSVVPDDENWLAKFVESEK